MPLQLDLLDTISAYRPVRCLASVFWPGANKLKKIILEVIINGSLATTLAYDMEEGPTGVFTATMDVQSILQDFLSPDQSDNTTTTSLGTNNSPYKVLNPDLFSQVEFSATYQEQLPSGKLQDIGIVETIGTYDVFANVAQNFDNMELFEFAPILGNTSRFLTNSPKVLDICLQDSYYLSLYTTALGLGTNTRIRVQTFDSSGALIQEGSFNYFALLTGTQQDQITGGFGPANLSAAVYDEGAVNILDPNVSYYHVEGGIFGLPSFLVTSETFRFNIVPCCDSYKVRLYWLNCKGGFDAVTMKYTQQTIDKSSTTIQRPLNWGPAPNYHNPQDKGKYPVNIEAIESFELEYLIKDKTFGVWLQELLYSPEIYAEIDGQPMQSVVILDSTPISDIKDDLSLFEVTIQPSNNIITMRN